MRDVTDNRTGELDVEVKRGRGRPRKEGAMTNAQRQAAFRARQRQTVTVTEKGATEVDALRAENADLRDRLASLQIRLDVVWGDAVKKGKALTNERKLRKIAMEQLVQVQSELAVIRDGGTVTKKMATARKAPAKKSVTRKT